MNKKALYSIILIQFLSINVSTQSTNGTHCRKKAPWPLLTTRWADEKEEYQFKAPYLKEKPLFHSFNKQSFEEHLLPQGAITFRNNPEQSVESSILNQQITELISELQAGKKRLSHFTVLKDKEFDTKDFAGLIVFKFNDYPFVLKLFAESPQSFLDPNRKGFQHGCMSRMTGGMNRYLSGFTRIQNITLIKNMINENELPIPLDFPRKWFWLPNNVRWFELTGKNFVAGQEIKTTMPEMYAIVADEIKTEKRLSQVRKTHGKTIFKICQQLKFNVDPNMKNFRIEKDTNKLVLIDTEHFLTMLGFRNGIMADNYFSLHVKMGIKAIHACWLS